MKFNHQKGFTLIELIIATSMFIFIVVVLSDVFITVVRGQRRNIAEQNAYDDLRYAIELMTREIRTGNGYEIINNSSPSYCNLSTPCLKIVNQASETIYFQNDNSLGVIMRILEGGSPEQITTGQSALTVLSIESLDAALGPENFQERVTLVIKAYLKEAEGSSNEEILVQTTISSRNY